MVEPTTTTSGNLANLGSKVQIYGTRVATIALDSRGKGPTWVQIRESKAGLLMNLMILRLSLRNLRSSQSLLIHLRTLTKIRRPSSSLPKKVKMIALLALRKISQMGMILRRKMSVVITKEPRLLPPLHLLLPPQQQHQMTRPSQAK
jgi:hypothetical protein